MRRQSPNVAVITGDIIGSSRYPRGDRQRVDRMLRAAFREAERRFPGAMHTRMAFRVTAGDEFQCVVRDVPGVMGILTYLRAVAATGTLEPPLRFRASVGIGDIAVSGRSNPYEEDGVAFARSRRGLEALNERRSPLRWTKLLTGERDKDAAADAVLGLADHLFEGWTAPQWEAVRWTILGHTREAVSRRLRIAHQNVTKRLRAAGWAHLEPALSFLAELLRESPGTLRRV